MCQDIGDTLSGPGVVSKSHRLWELFRDIGFMFYLATQLGEGYQKNQNCIALGSARYFKRKCFVFVLSFGNSFPVCLILCIRPVQWKIPRFGLISRLTFMCRDHRKWLRTFLDVTFPPLGGMEQLLLEF